MSAKLTATEQAMLDRLKEAESICWLKVNGHETRTLNRLAKKGCVGMGRNSAGYMHWTPLPAPPEVKP